MNYQALYRVWRPQRLADVVGQEHITKTLQNALVQEKVSHAYLFSGPRGTGKTSAAKIMAKAINCERAPVAEPCNTCAACVGITDGSIVDVLEIDAASNNGVDEIRDIRENVKFAPNEVKYKVYIIDEVHMLSTPAFNALLKTLEEPPNHVLFILATTESHKIPATILSRCQRFDFKRLTANVIEARLQYIVEQEQVTVEKDALSMIARAAEGGMRDAISLLDQAISYATETVQLDDVIAISGTISNQALVNVVTAIFEKDTVRLLQLVDELLQEGKDPLRFIDDLIFYFRDILLYKNAPQAKELLERAFVDETFLKFVNNMETSWLYKTIESLNASQQEMRWAIHPRILLELACIQLINHSDEKGEKVSPPVEVLQEVKKLTEKVVHLEKKLAAVESNDHTESPATSRPAPVRRRQVSPQTNRVTGAVVDMLKDADHKSLQAVKSKWTDVMERLKQQSVPAHAWLSDSEPVAATNETVVLAFKNEMHRDMIDTKFRHMVEPILQQQLKTQQTFETILAKQYENIKDSIKNEDDEIAEDDSLITEAVKLVGEDLIEIKE